MGLGDTQGINFTQNTFPSPLKTGEVKPLLKAPCPEEIKGPVNSAGVQGNLNILDDILKNYQGPSVKDQELEKMAKGEKTNIFEGFKPTKINADSIKDGVAISDDGFGPKSGRKTTIDDPGFGPTGGKGTISDPGFAPVKTPEVKKELALPKEPEPSLPEEPLIDQEELKRVSKTKTYETPEK